MPASFYIYAVVSFAVIVASGVKFIKMLTLAYEASMEFGGDSLTKRSRIKGFAFFAVWLVAACINWSFVFDWLLTGSAEVALARLYDKAYILILLLEALSND